MKLVVYTCVTADYDPIRPVAYPHPDIKYICFSDRTGPLPWPWVRGELPRGDLNAKDTNRFVKMFPHRLDALAGHDVSVYVDGSIELVGNTLEFARKTVGDQDSGVWMFEHPLRDCVYEEGYACAVYAHDWVWTIAEQLRRYREAGLPRKSGLFEANVILRFQGDTTMHRLMSAWWTEYCAGAKRDQIALPQAIRSTGGRIQSLGLSDVRDGNAYFKFVPHKRRIRLSTNIRKLVNRTAIRAIGSTLFPAEKSDA